MILTTAVFLQLFYEAGLSIMILAWAAGYFAF